MRHIIPKSCTLFNRLKRDSSRKNVSYVFYSLSRCSVLLRNMDKDCLRDIWRFFFSSVFHTMRVHLHKKNLLKQKSFSLAFSMYKWQNNPHSHGSAKTTKKLYYACYASSWHCHFVKKHYVLTDRRRNMHAHNASVFTN